jgi:tripartite-type tricarboxylate transporter receptor subunit TctC
MHYSRRTAIAGLGALALARLSGIARAEDYPSRVIRVLIPRAPGGGSDIIARLLAGPMQERTGQPFIVENRPDASAVIAAQQVARSQPDGYTVLLADNAPTRTRRSSRTCHTIRCRISRR